MILVAPLRRILPQYDGDPSLRKRFCGLCDQPIYTFGDMVPKPRGLLCNRCYSECVADVAMSLVEGPKE